MTTDRIGLHSVLLPLLIHTESFAFFLWHIYFLKTIENFFPLKLFQAKRSHCLTSSSYFGAGSLYVFWSTIIQMIPRGFTSRELAGRSPFAIRFANPSDTMSACAPPFSLQGFPTFADYISSYRCARNFDNLSVL